jgi:hypothetical protein
MRTQEQAFKAYYASMSDAELLAVANNRTSFIPTAQKVLDEELHRRQVTPADSRVETSHPPSPTAGPTRPPELPKTRYAAVGATEDQVSMVGTVPARVNRQGTKIEDLAGTGQHDSMGG